MLTMPSYLMLKPHETLEYVQQRARFRGERMTQQEAGAVLLGIAMGRLRMYTRRWDALMREGLPDAEAQRQAAEELGLPTAPSGPAPPAPPRRRTRRRPPA
jgi:hypothetical protein